MESWTAVSVVNRMQSTEGRGWGIFVPFAASLVSRTSREGGTQQTDVWRMEGEVFGRTGSLVHGSLSNGIRAFEN